MHDKTTKGLLFLIFLALVLNAFVLLVRPSRAADGQVGRYAVSAYGFRAYGPNGDSMGDTGYYRVDTATGEVKQGR